MQFCLQKPIFTFDYKGNETSQIIDSIENLATSVENKGFDSFWVMDHFHQIPMIGKPEEPMLESWTTLFRVSRINYQDQIRNPSYGYRLQVSCDSSQDSCDL